jgi:hypothetical protein
MVGAPFREKRLDPRRRSHLLSRLNDLCCRIGLIADLSQDPETDRGFLACFEAKRELGVVGSERDLEQVADKATDRRRASPG